MNRRGFFSLFEEYDPDKIEKLMREYKPTPPIRAGLGDLIADSDRRFAVQMLELWGVPWDRAHRYVSDIIINGCDYDGCCRG